MRIGEAGMNDVPSFRLRGIPPEMVETFAHLVFSPDREVESASLHSKM